MKRIILALLLILFASQAHATTYRICDLLSGTSLQATDHIEISRACAGSYNLTGTQLESSVAAYAFANAPGTPNGIFFNSGGTLATGSASAVRGLLGLSTVAATGAYSDLSGKPALATVATSGLYSDLTGQPTALSQFTNDSAFITASGAPVQSVAGRTGAVTLSKSDVGLGSVENTALSTWPGSSNVTTLGTQPNTLKINKNAAGLPAAQTGTALQLGGADGVTSRIENNAYGAAAGYSGIRYDSTDGAPGALLAGEEINYLNALGYNGTGIVGPMASIREFTSQNWSVGSNGTYIDIATTPNGTAALTSAGRIENDGGLTWPPTVTGGSKGSGTINVSSGYYVGGARMLLRPPSGVLETIGDSLFQFAQVIGGTGPSFTIQNHGRGRFYWFQALEGYPLEYTTLYKGVGGQGLPPYLGNNVGVAGDWSYQNINRFDRDMGTQQPPGVIGLQIGTNDVANGLSENLIFGQIKTLVKKSLALHPDYVILFSIPPRNNLGGTALTGPEEAVRLAINADELTLPTLFPGKVFSFQQDSLLIDPGTGLLNTAYSQGDGVHLNPLGEYILAKNLIVPWYQSLGGQVLPRSIPDDYNSSTVQLGNIIANSDFTGTGGTIATGCSGTQPTSWRCSRDIGSTVAGASSIASVTDWNGTTRSAIQLVYTANGTGATHEASNTRPISNITTNVTTGSWYRGEVEFYLTSGGSPVLEAPYIQLTDGTTNGDSVYGFGPQVQTIDTYPSGATHYVMRTPPIQVKGTTGLQLTLWTRIDGTQTGSVTVQWVKPVIIPIPAPELVPGQISNTLTTGSTISIQGEDNVLYINKASASATAVSWRPYAPAGKTAKLSVVDQGCNAATGNITVSLITGGTVNGTSTVTTNCGALNLFSDGTNAWSH